MLHCKPKRAHGHEERGGDQRPTMAAPQAVESHVFAQGKHRHYPRQRGLQGFNGSRHAARDRNIDGRRARRILKPRRSMHGRDGSFILNIAAAIADFPHEVGLISDRFRFRTNPHWLRWLWIGSLTFATVSTKHPRLTPLRNLFRSPQTKNNLCG